MNKLSLALVVGALVAAPIIGLSAVEKTSTFSQGMEKKDATKVTETPKSIKDADVKKGKMMHEEKKEEVKTTTPLAFSLFDDSKKEVKPTKPGEGTPPTTDEVTVPKTERHHVVALGDEEKSATDKKVLPSATDKVPSTTDKAPMTDDYHNKTAE